MKRYLSLLLAVVFCLTVAAGCAKDGKNAQAPVESPAQSAAPSADPEEAGLFTPGKYTGEGKGFGGTIVMEVEVDAQKIVSITAVEHKETAGISDPAFARIPAAVIEAQSLAVDTVAGCTLASEGILAAITDALSRTASDMTQFQKAAAAEGPKGSDTEDTADVVIIGAGGAGMAAAAEIVQAGKSVILVDKMPTVGGNTLVAGSAMNGPDPDMQKKIEMDPGMKDVIQRFIDMESKNEIMAGWQAALQEEFAAYNAEKATYLFDSPSLHKLQTYVDGDYAGNPKLIDVYGDNALPAIKWLESLGTEWKDVSTAIGATWMRSHNPDPKMGPKGAAFFNPTHALVQEKGGKICTEHTAQEIVMEGGRAVGVKGTKEDGSGFTFHANNAVIIATGGFGTNVAMRQEYNKHWPTLDASISTTNVSSATGDGILLAQAAGANLVGMEWIQMLNYARVTFTADIANRIFVNAEGKRFVKEDGRRDEIAYETLQQTDGKYFSICDAHTVQDLLGGMAVTGKPVDELVNNETFFKGETLEEACKKAGLPYEVVKAEVEDYNLNSVEKGSDKFGRKVVQFKLDKGPFYINSGKPMVHHTMGGIEINEKTQVIGTNGSVIPGLYAAGEVTGGIHGANRLGGNAITDVIVFGRIAGQSAASE